MTAESEAQLGDRRRARVRDVRTIELHTWSERGANGRNVLFELAQNSTSAHVSEFPVGTYKKAHRHGPGVLIVIPAGEGFSIMWQEGKEKIMIPWHEASIFVPPNRWFHQHFNVSDANDRYLAFHAPRGAGETSERIERVVVNAAMPP